MLLKIVIYIKWYVFVSNNDGRFYYLRDGRVWKEFD